ncbi:hypothetical protein BRC82_00635 [Halobacteriales archaeon QS_1_67_19]|nr:MAG: hypothetical protein BRC82_00635 [Halobacteriales archaeon QS_1_67_19]
MTRNATLGEHTYRRAYVGLWVAAGVLFGVLIGVGYKLWAVAAFFLLAGATFVVERTYEGPLFDERDESVHRVASAKTIGFYGVLSAIAFPVLVALDALGLYEWGPMTAGIAWAVAILYVTYGAMSVLVGRNR